MLSTFFADIFVRRLTSIVESLPRAVLTSPTQRSNHGVSLWHKSKARYDWNKNLKAWKEL